MKAGDKTKQALQKSADTPLVWCGSNVYNGTDIEFAVEALAAKLSTVAAPCARIGIWAWNSAETIVAHLAAERAGLARVPVDPEAPRAEAKQVFESAKVAATIVDEEHEEPATTAVPLFTLGADVWTSQLAEYTPPSVSDDDESLLIVRGAMPGGLLAIPLSIRSWEAHMCLAESLFRNGGFGRALNSNPFFVTVQQIQYATGLLGTFPFIRMGLPQAVLKKFHAEDLAATVVRHNATATFAVPGMINRLAESMSSETPKNWRLTILYGGAPFVVDDMRNAMSVLGNELVQLYGRFEGGWPLTILSPEDHREIMSGDSYLASSCGRRVEGVELDLRPVVGSPFGELRSRSDCVSDAFKDPDGWCSLGDLATRDDKGYFFLRGRLDNMINTGSFHVYPEEVASAIEIEFTNAIDVRVEGREDAKWGEAVTAVITWPNSQEAPSEHELRNRLSGRLAKYKIPTKVEYSYSSK